MDHDTRIDADRNEAKNDHHDDDFEEKINMINIVVDDAHDGDDDVDDDHDDDHDHDHDDDDDDDDDATALCYSGSLLQLMVCHFKAMDGLSESCITCINGGWCQGKPYH